MTWDDGAAGAAVLVAFVLLVLLVRAVAGFLASRVGPSRGQTIDTSEPASNVLIRGDVSDVSYGAAGIADRKGLAGYLLKELRREGLLPSPAAERTAQTDALVAHQEKEAGFLLAKAFEKLPAREKTVITLQFSQRLAAAELARSLGISTSTVYRLRRSALQRLADAVRPAFEMP